MRKSHRTKVGRRKVIRQQQRIIDMLAKQLSDFIDDEIVNDMIAKWEEPSEDEGFDKIIHVS